jgi:hypothetical protein
MSDLGDSLKFYPYRDQLGQPDPYSQEYELGSTERGRKFAENRD